MGKKILFNPLSGKFDFISKEDISGFVPYNGAVDDLNLATHNIYATGFLAGNKTDDSTWGFALGNNVLWHYDASLPLINRWKEIVRYVDSSTGIYAENYPWTFTGNVYLNESDMQISQGDLTLLDLGFGGGSITADGDILSKSSVGVGSTAGNDPQTVLLRQDVDSGGKNYGILELTHDSEGMPTFWYMYPELVTGGTDLNIVGGGTGYGKVIIKNQTGSASLEVTGDIVSSSYATGKGNSSYMWLGDDGLWFNDYDIVEGSIARRFLTEQDDYIELGEGHKQIFLNDGGNGVIVDGVLTAYSVIGQSTVMAGTEGVTNTTRITTDGIWLDNITPSLAGESYTITTSVNPLDSDSMDLNITGGGVGLGKINLNTNTTLGANSLTIGNFIITSFTDPGIESSLNFAQINDTSIDNVNFNISNAVTANYFQSKFYTTERGTYGHNRGYSLTRDEGSTFNGLMYWTGANYEAILRINQDDNKIELGGNSVYDTPTGNRKIKLIGYGNGFLKTSNSDGTLVVDTNTYADNFSYEIVALGLTITIPINQQMIVHDNITIDGDLVEDGNLVLI
jgi:hypothetical protein